MIDPFSILENINSGKNDKCCWTIFNSARKPKISISAYVRRLYKYIIRDYEIFIFTLYYMALYAHHTDLQVDEFNVHRLFLSSTTVAHKFWDDESYGNSQIAKIVGVPIKELNLLEREFLIGIQWGLYNLQTKITEDELSQIAERITGVKYTTIEERNEDIDTTQITVMVHSIINDIINKIIDEKTQKT